MIKLIPALIFFLVISCDDPVTVVTNYVHPDGSVTRKIEMRNVVNKFEQSKLQIPFDETWTIKDSIEINEKGDTIWVKRAEKLFAGIEEINSAYKLDSGVNSEASRSASFRKSFKWFNTTFRFSERIDAKITGGYPVQDFLNKDELLYFYSPQNLIDEQNRGADSLKFKTLKDSIDIKTERWALKNLVSGWINAFGKLTEAKDSKEMVSDLRKRESEIFETIESKNEIIDSLWDNGLLQKEFLGVENALKYKQEADSAMSLVAGELFPNFSDYSVRIVMPGKLTGTNGFIDSTNVLLWPVRSDFFFTQPYEMWAESKVPNVWAWVISGLFLIFVLTGVILKTIKKG